MVADQVSVDMRTLAKRWSRTSLLAGGRGEASADSTDGEDHLESIDKKLGVHYRASAVSHALREGLMH